MDYKVEWVINIEAETPLDAARQALKIQRDPESTAVVFLVTDSEAATGELIDLEGQEAPDEQDSLRG